MSKSSVCVCVFFFVYHCMHFRDVVQSQHTHTHTHTNTVDSSMGLMEFLKHLRRSAKSVVLLVVFPDERTTRHSAGGEFNKINTHSGAICSTTAADSCRVYNMDGQCGKYTKHYIRIRIIIINTVCIYMCNCILVSFLVI